MASQSCLPTLVTVERTKIQPGHTTIQTLSQIGVGELCMARLSSQKASSKLGMAMLPPTTTLVVAPLEVVRGYALLSYSQRTSTASALVLQLGGQLTCNLTQ